MAPILQDYELPRLDLVGNASLSSLRVRIPMGLGAMFSTHLIVLHYWCDIFGSSPSEERCTLCLPLRSLGSVPLAELHYGALFYGSLCGGYDFMALAYTVSHSRVPREGTDEAVCHWLCPSLWEEVRCRPIHDVVEVMELLTATMRSQTWWLSLLEPQLLILSMGTNDCYSMRFQMADF